MSDGQLSAMFQTAVSCDLWDLVDEGVDAVLDRLAGEAGAAAVSVPVVRRTSTVFRPHPGVTPRTLRSAGGLQFQPVKDAYAGTRIRPITAEWLKKSNPLAGVAEACTRRGLSLRGQITCCYNELLASRFEFCAAKDVFGDPHPAWLCPSSPDVCEYLKAFTADLSENYAFETLEVDAAWFPPALSWSGWRMPGVDLGPAGAWLLGLCFCESCRQAADAEGLDSAAAARSATVRLERSLSAGEPVRPSLAELLDQDPVLRSYARWRNTQVTRLAGKLREACRCRLVIRRPDDSDSVDVDARSIAQRGDALMIAVSPAGDSEAAIHEVSAEAGAMDRIEIEVSACAPECRDSAWLVRTLSVAARMGVRAASVASYGQLPLARLQWIKQAARYAQRESG